MPGAGCAVPRRVALGLAVLVGAVGGAGVLVAARTVRGRGDGSTSGEVLQEAANDAPAENYLLVGSDSREGVDPTIRTPGHRRADDAVGRRSDTIMVLRREPGGGASLLSLPATCGCRSPARGERAEINAAYNGGPDVLAQTVTQALGIPIQHYVEVDFVGLPAARRRDRRRRDLLAVRGPGHQLRAAAGPRLPDPRRLAGAGVRPQPALPGVHRRRVGADRKNDLGRIERQQTFIRTAVDSCWGGQSDPFR